VKLNLRSIITICLMLLVAVGGYFLNKPWIQTLTRQANSPLIGQVAESDQQQTGQQQTGQKQIERNLVPFLENGRWGYQDGDSQEIVVPPQYRSAANYREGLALVQVEENRYAYLDQGGREAIAPFTAKYALSFREGLAARGDGQVGQYIDPSGQVVMTMNCLVNYSFHYGLARVALGEEQWGFIDKEGRWAIYAKYQYVDDFSEGLAAARQDGKYGFIFTNGNWAISPHFDGAAGFSYGLAAAAEGGKWGFIDRTGNWVIPARFDQARNFLYDGVTEVLIGRDWYHMDRSGTLLDKF
jgi:hypothetical protein